MSDQRPLPRRLRACGPLALERLLGRFGVAVPLEQIVPHVCALDGRGCLSARSYLLGRFAKQFGLEVLVVQCQANRSWEAIEWCSSQGMRVIVNHQAEWSREEGHYSVLIEHSPDAVELDDPILQRRVIYSRPHFEELWNSNGETPGHVILAVSKLDAANSWDADCQFTCPRCGWSNSLQTARPDDASLWGRGGLFRQFYCLGCDVGFRQGEPAARVLSTAS